MSKIIDWYNGTEEDRNCLRWWYRLGLEIQHTDYTNMEHWLTYKPSPEVAEACLGDGIKHRFYLGIQFRLKPHNES